MIGRRLFVAAGILSISALGAACGSSASPAPASPQPVTTAGTSSAPSTGPSAATEPVTLKVWSQLGDNAALQPVLDKLNQQYMADHPNATVEIEYQTLEGLTKTVPTTLSSGAGPDIIDYDANESTLGSLARNGLLADLTPYAAKYGWNTQLYQWVQDRETHDGKLSGVGRSNEAVGLFYNADIFKKLNIEPPTTYEKFLAAADALKKNKLIPLAFGNSEQWPSSHLIGAAVHANVPVATIAGFETLAGTGSWVDPKVIAAFEQAVEWAKKGYLPDGFNGIDFDQTTKQFFSGDAGMYVEGTGLIPDITSNMEGVDVQFVSFPMIDTSIPQQAEGGLGGAWAINASSKAADSAAEWIDYVHFAPDAQKAWYEAGVAPTTNFDVSGITVPKLIEANAAVLGAAGKGGGIGFWSGYASDPIVTDAWNAGAQQMLDGSLSSADFAAQLKAALEQARAAAQ